jgi:hypothetical protein
MDEAPPDYDYYEYIYDMDEARPLTLPILNIYDMDEAPPNHGYYLYMCI